MNKIIKRYVNLDNLLLVYSIALWTRLMWFSASLSNESSGLLLGIEITFVFFDIISLLSPVLIFAKYGMSINNLIHRIKELTLKQVPKQKLLYVIVPFLLILPTVLDIGNILVLVNMLIVPATIIPLVCFCFKVNSN